MLEEIRQPVNLGRRNKDTDWCALVVRPRFEKVVSLHLRRKGYEEFLPLYRRPSREAGNKEIELPLFPGLVFCRFNEICPPPILMIPGVKTVAGMGADSKIVAGHEINNIHAIVKSGAHCEPWSYRRVGQTVFLQYGPLAGMQGILVDDKNRLRFVVSLNALQRSAAVEIEHDWLERVGGPSSGTSSAISQQLLQQPAASKFR